MASLITTLNVDKIKAETLCLVNGFIHETEKTINIIIPDSIMMVILSFYYIIEHFAEWGSDITVSDGKLTATGNATSSYSAYGKILIPADNENQDKYIWKLEINRIGITEYTPRIDAGIIDSKNKILYTDMYYKPGAYIFASNGWLITHAQNGHKFIYETMDCVNQISNQRQILIG